MIGCALTLQELSTDYIRAACNTVSEYIFLMLGLILCVSLPHQIPAQMTCTLNGKEESLLLGHKKLQFCTHCPRTLHPASHHWIHCCITTKLTHGKERNKTNFFTS